MTVTEYTAEDFEHVTLSCASYRIVYRYRGCYAIVSDDGTTHSFASNRKDAGRLLRAYRAGFDIPHRADAILPPFTDEVNKAIGLKQ